MDDGKYDDDFPTEDKPVEIIVRNIILIYFLFNQVQNTSMFKKYVNFNNYKYYEYNNNNLIVGIIYFKSFNLI